MFTILHFICKTMFKKQIIIQNAKEEILPESLSCPTNLAYFVPEKLLNCYEKPRINL